MGLRRTSITAIAAGLMLVSCKHSPHTAKPDDYPEAIRKIFITKCAISGCHNQLSYENAAGLNLGSWDDLFKGAGSGAAVIPYRPDFSPLCYFINTDTSLGISLSPAMPLNMPPLSREEYITITCWITSGAPSAAGRIKWSDNPDRKKIYVTNRMCDVVTVLDAETSMPMRYIDVGIRPGIEYPVCVKVSPDKKQWYVSFFSESGTVQKFNASDDKAAGILQLGSGIWTSFYISKDSRYGYFVDNSSPGRITLADLDQMKVLYTFNNAGKLQYPTGIVVNEELRKIYTGAANGNFIYSIDISDSLHWIATELPIDGSGTPLYQSLQNPAELIEGEYNLCYIACTGSGEIRTVNMETGKIVSIIPLGANPAFLALHPPTQKLFVTCPDDTLSFPGNRGSVKIVDLATQSLIKTLNSGYQPYGIAIDYKRNIVAIANANISIKGPSSHHASRCGVKNGNLSFIDLNTLALIPNRKVELSVYPFGVALR
jgi:YVTN family beta-propeller protein